MSVVRELVTLVRYQADDSELKAFQQAFGAMLSTMTQACDQAAAVLRQAFAGVLPGALNARQAVNAVTLSPPQTPSAGRQQAPALGGLRGVIELTLGATPFKRILGDIDTWAQMQSRMRQATRSESQYGEADRDVARISRVSRTPYADNADTFMRTRQVLEDQGKRPQDASRITEALALSMTLSGNPAQDRGGAVTSLIRMIEQGKLGLEEYNTLPQRMQDALAAGLDVDRGQLREQVRGGLVTSDRALPALQSQLPRMRAEAESAPASISGSMAVFNDALQRYFGETLPGGQTVLRAITQSVQYLADNIDTVVKLLALAGASLGLVTLGSWLRQATQQSGELIRSLGAAMRVAIGLDSAMALRNGPAGAMQMLSTWTRSLAPLLRMAAILTTIYLIGTDIVSWLNGGDSVLGGWIGGVEAWRGEIDAVSAGLTFVKDLLGGAGQALGPWVMQFGTIAVMAYGLWQILSPIGGVILSLARIALPLLSSGFQYLAGTVVPMLGNALLYIARTVIPVLWNTFAMTPIGRIISAISLLAIALWQIWENWDLIKAYLSASWDQLMAMAYDGFLGPVMEYITALWNLWTEIVQGVVAAFTGDWDGAVKHWLGAFNGLWTFFSDMGGRMVATIKEIGGAIQTWVLDKVNKAKDWFKGLVPDWMKDDEQASVMDAPRAMAEVPPQLAAVAGGISVPYVPAGTVVGATPSPGRAPFVFQSHNDIVVNVSANEAQAVRSGVVQGLNRGLQNNLDTLTQNFDVTSAVEVRS